MRSKLEAQWAFFFDSIGVVWGYEPESFEIDGCVDRRKYTPDFYLPDLLGGVYVEVKPEGFADYDVIHAFVRTTGHSLLLAEGFPCEIPQRLFSLEAFGDVLWSRVPMSPEIGRLREAAEVSKAEFLEDSDSPDHVFAFFDWCSTYLANGVTALSPNKVSIALSPFVKAYKESCRLELGFNADLYERRLERILIPRGFRIKRKDFSLTLEVTSSTDFRFITSGIQTIEDDPKLLHVAKKLMLTICKILDNEATGNGDGVFYDKEKGQVWVTTSTVVNAFNNEINKDGEAGKVSERMGGAILKILSEKEFVSEMNMKKARWKLLNWRQVLDQAIKYGWPCKSLHALARAQRVQEN